MTKEFSKTIKGEVENLLAYLSLSENKDQHKFPQHYINLWNLPPVEPWLDPIRDKTKGEDIADITADATPEDLDRDPNVAILTVNDNSEVKWQVSALTKVQDPRQVRGIIKPFAWPLYKIGTGLISPEGRVMTLNQYVKKGPGGKWIAASPRPRVFGKSNDELDVDLSFRLQTLCGVAFRQRYEWSVIVGTHNRGPRLRLVVPPRAIPPLFKLRDLPDGRERRSSLKHWVESYYRQHPEKDEDVYVRKHLRGSLKFNYEDLSMEVIPSDYDLMLNERYKEERRAR